jgi:hypothetical protein
LTKIIFGINVPYRSTEIDWEATDKLRKETGKIYFGDYVRVPCIRHKELSFELCDICGNFIPYGRVSRGITTCTPKCNKKKWDTKNGLIIERERNAEGIRPTNFWQTISLECFQRDDFTCQKCNRTSDDLRKLQQIERNKRDYKPENYILHCHHIKAIKDGGNNKLENLTTLCGKDHKLEHSHVGNMKRKHKCLEVD